MRFILAGMALLTCCGALVAGDPKPVPRVQAVPQAYEQVSFQVDGVEWARYHYGKELRRPFVFPLIGPSGRSVTRMGHPHDPDSHSHHNSVWISHESVNGISFWGDHGKGRIVHQKFEGMEDGDDHAAIQTINHWIDESAGEEAKGKVLIKERRGTRVQPMAHGEWLLTIDLQLEAMADEVTFGKSPFGLIGVRMAKTIDVNDGGGTIRNSEGAVDEKEAFWKPARWCDYSGPITSTAVEGITLMDHPSNPNHPCTFHVRNDGWMGACFTFDEPRVMKKGETVTLRYGLWVHSGMPAKERVEEVFKAFAGSKRAEVKK
jgi:hypothetical protein